MGLLALIKSQSGITDGGKDEIPGSSTKGLSELRSLASSVNYDAKRSGTSKISESKRCAGLIQFH
jgi:hypothetical protein